MSVERLPDFALDDGRPLGREFAALRLGSYREAARYVRSLPYGRNTYRSDWRLVLKEEARRLLHQTRPARPREQPACRSDAGYL